MSQPELVVVESTPAVVEVVEELAAVIEVELPGGPPGPPGPPGQWEQLTQAEFDALSPPDPNTLYVIVG